MSFISSFLPRIAQEFDELYEAFFAAQEGLEEGSFFDAARPGVDSFRASARGALAQLEPRPCGK